MALLVCIIPKQQQCISLKSGYNQIALLKLFRFCDTVQSLACALQEYLRDGGHPNTNFLNNVLNTYLNMLTEGDSSQGL